MKICLIDTADADTFAFDLVIDMLEDAKAGFSVRNEDNGREVEVTCMTGGRYLCLDPDGEPVKQTDNASVAYNFLLKNPDPDDQKK